MSDGFGAVLSPAARVASGGGTVSGHGPVGGAEGEPRIAVAGWMTNAADVRAALDRVGRRRPDEGEVALLRAAYRHWGDAVAERVEGPCAFVVCDDARGRLTAVRDRAGTRGVYWASVGDGIAIASEPRRLLPLLPAAPSLEPTALAHLLCVGHVPAPLTVWRGIRKLGPGRMLVWEPDRVIRGRTYWAPPAQTGAAAVRRRPPWDELFERVLLDHAEGAPQPAVLLSGGFDSSAIALGLRSAGRPVETISMRHPEPEADESEQAAATAERLGLPHRAVDLELDPADELLARVGRVFDEPQTHRALMGRVAVATACASRVRTALGGEGAEEVLGARPWYAASAGDRRVGGSTLRRLKRWLRHPRAMRLRVASDRFARRSRLHAYARARGLTFLPDEAESLLAPTGVRFGEDELLAPLERHQVGGLPPRRALQRIDLMTFVADGVLMKLDRTAAAQDSLEVRLPYLDARIVEWCLARPEDPREARERKPLLRDYLQGWVPDAVLEGPPRGLVLDPMDAWGDAWVLDRIRRGALVRDGMLRKRWERHVASGVPHRRSRLWTLLLLTVWADFWRGAEVAAT